MERQTIRYPLNFEGTRKAILDLLPKQVPLTAKEAAHMLNVRIQDRRVQYSTRHTSRILLGMHKLGEAEKDTSKQYNEYVIPTG